MAAQVRPPSALLLLSSARVRLSRPLAERPPKDRRGCACRWRAALPLSTSRPPVSYMPSDLCMSQLPLDTATGFSAGLSSCVRMSLSMCVASMSNNVTFSFMWEYHHSRGVLILDKRQSTFGSFGS